MSHIQDKKKAALPQRMSRTACKVGHNISKWHKNRRGLKWMCRVLGSHTGQVLWPTFKWEGPTARGQLCLPLNFKGTCMSLIQFGCMDWRGAEVWYSQEYQQHLPAAGTEEAVLKIKRVQVEYRDTGILDTLWQSWVTGLLTSIPEKIANTFAQFLSFHKPIQTNFPNF